MPCFARVFGVIVICSKFTDFGKSEQDGASCYYLLVVKLVVKRKRLLLKKTWHISVPSFLYDFIILINIEIIEIQFLVLFHISQLLTHKCTSTSIIAKLTPYISTIIMSRIVIKIGNCNLFLYSAIFTLQPKSTVSRQIIAYCCKSILTIPSENVHAAHVSPDRNYLAPDIGWKQPIPSLGESL